MSVVEKNADPYRRFQFALLYKGHTMAEFSSASGIGVEEEVAGYSETGADGKVRVLPGKVQLEPVTLERGVSTSQELHRWYESAALGQPERRDVSIVLFGIDSTTEAAGWKFYDAWVSTFQAAPLSPRSSEIAIEKIKIVYARMERGQG